MSLLPIVGPTSLPFSIADISADGVSYLEDQYYAAGYFGLFWKPDGTQLFGTDNTTDISVLDLSTAWDISTAVYNSSFDTNLSHRGHGLEFSDDGLKVFVLDESVGRIREADLSSAYGGTGTPSTQLATKSGVTTLAFAFDDDGDRIFTHDGSTFYEITLSTPYDLSTAGSWSAGLVTPGTSGDDYSGFAFGRGGAQMLVCQTDGAIDYIREFSLSPAYDLSSATLLRSANVSTGANQFGDVIYGSGGRKLYTLDGDGVHQFSTVT